MRDAFKPVTPLCKYRDKRSSRTIFSDPTVVHIVVIVPAVPLNDTPTCGPTSVYTDVAENCFMPPPKPDSVTVTVALIVPGVGVVLPKEFTVIWNK